MRLLLCHNNDFLGNYALNLLWPHIRHHQVAFALSDYVSTSAKKAAIFFTWGALERRRVFEELFASKEAAENPHANTFRSFRQLAASQGGHAPVFANINSPEALDYVKTVQPDLIISLRFTSIFKDPLLFSLPRLGIINLHSGLLPQYRGMHVPFWVMLNREREMGCTLHYIRDTGIDKGDVLEEYRMPVSYERSMLWNIARMYEEAVKMIPRAVERMEREGTVPALPQRTEGAGYYSFPQDEDVARFEREIGRLYEERDYDELFAPYGMEESCLQTA